MCAHFYRYFEKVYGWDHWFNVLLILITLLQSPTGYAESTPIDMFEKSKLLDKATLVVDISEQQLYLYEGLEIQADNMIKSYPVSTSKYGIGSQKGSNKTPLGRHRIENKIGESAPKNMIFKARQRTGKIAKINVKGAGDVITSRIMWLKGLEPGKNAGPGRDSYQRYIYIHGTTEEDKIGQPASHGCIRMYNDDVIDLFDRVGEGTIVNIIK